MKIIVIISIFLCFVGCGKDPSVQSGTKITPIKHQIYIISGQSNAGRLLASVIQNFDPTQLGESNQSTLVLKENSRVVGYGVGGITLKQWNEPEQINVLIPIVQENCNLNPLFVWWQGESDANPLNLNYKNELNSFFTMLKGYCPTMKIVEIVMEDSNLYSNYDYIQKIQSQSGDYQFSVQSYIVEDPIHSHMMTKGYKEVWDDLTMTFPLSSM